MPEDVRQDHRVFPQGVLIVKRLQQRVHREILSVEVGLTENEVFWAELLKGMKQQEPEEIRWVISDDLRGLKETSDSYFQ